MRSEAAVKQALAIRCDQTAVILSGGHAIELEHSAGVHRLRRSDDGARVAGAMNDRSVRIWDAHTGALVAELRGHLDLVLGVAFSPDGTRLATSSYDKTIRIWELATIRHRVLRGHAGAVEHVVWRGAHLISGARDGTLRVWKVPSIELPSGSEIRARLAAATSAEIDVGAPSLDLDRPTTPDRTRGSL